MSKPGIGALMLRLYSTAVCCVALISYAFAVPDCNSKKPGPITDCGNDELCANIGPQFCPHANAAFDPNNCLQAYRDAQRERWACTSVQQNFLGCDETGPLAVCEKWIECYFTDMNLNCHKGVRECNYPQTINNVAQDIVPCNPPPAG